MSHDSPSSTPRDGSPLLKGKRPDLIELIAATLHSVKAYDLPAECERLGLATGTGTPRVTIVVAPIGSEHSVLGSS